jgi:hypothetical protein
MQMTAQQENRQGVMMGNTIIKTPFSFDREI